MPLSSRTAPDGQSMPVWLGEKALAINEFERGLRRDPL